MASLTAALSGHFPVVAANSAQQALRLATRHGSCRLAYCQMGDNAAATLTLARRLTMARPGLAVIALARPPCPPSIRHAVTASLLDDALLLPVSPETLRTKAQIVLASPAPDGIQEGRSRGILTREEVNFLLGRPTPDKEAGRHHRL